MMFASFMYTVELLATESGASNDNPTIDTLPSAYFACTRAVEYSADCADAAVVTLPLSVPLDIV